MISVALSGTVYTNEQGYNTLANFYRECSTHSNCTINIDLSGLKHLQANLCALWLAMLEDLKQSNCLLFQIEQKYWHQNKSYGDNFHILLRNKFVPTLANLEDDFRDFKDERESTIELRKFDRQDYEEFANYINQSFLAHRGCALSQDDKDHLKNAYMELFNNYTEHAQTEKPVYVCGQFFPKNGQLIFTLTDVGMGFLSPIRAYTAQSTLPIIEAKDAIIWAMQGNNSTRKSEGFGGGGLKDIARFCEQPKRKFHIITDGVYAKFEAGKVSHIPLDAPFKGTTVHLLFQ